MENKVKYKLYSLLLKNNMLSEIASNISVKRNLLSMEEEYHSRLDPGPFNDCKALISRVIVYNGIEISMPNDVYHVYYNQYEDFINEYSDGKITKIYNYELEEAITKLDLLAGEIIRIYGLRETLLAEFDNFNTLIPRDPQIEIQELTLKMKYLKKQGKEDWVLYDRLSILLEFQKLGMFRQNEKGEKKYAERTKKMFK